MEDWRRRISVVVVIAVIIVIIVIIVVSAQIDGEYWRRVRAEG